MLSEELIEQARLIANVLPVSFKALEPVGKLLSVIPKYHRLSCSHAPWSLPLARHTLIAF